MKADSQALKAYHAIRKAILSQHLAPNTRLKEDDWAFKVEVSRMAVREALNRLLGEGIVVSGEKGGYFVVALTLHDIKLIRELREILEVGAIKLAINRLTSAHLKQLEQICDDFTTMSKQGYFNGACEADVKFHETLIKCADNKKLHQVYQASHIPLFHNKLGKSLIATNDFELTDVEHRKIVRALKAKDEELAKETLLSHFKRGYDAII